MVASIGGLTRYRPCVAATGRRTVAVTSGCVIERMLFDQEFVDDAAGNQVLLNDALQYGGIAGGIPGTFGVYHGNRASFTDPEAVGLRPEDAALIGETKLLQTPLEEFPRSESPFFLAAFGGRLIAAKKDMTSALRDTDGAGDRPLAIPGAIQRLYHGVVINRETPNARIQTAHAQQRLRGHHAERPRRSGVAVRARALAAVPAAVVLPLHRPHHERG